MIHHATSLSKQYYGTRSGETLNLLPILAWPVDQPTDQHKDTCHYGESSMSKFK